MKPSLCCFGIGRRKYLSLSGLLLLALLLAPVAEGASLKWEERKINVTATARQESVETVFSFRNESAKEVAIRSVKPACDCTVADLEKRTYAPGEAGGIKVKLKLDGRVGQQEKTIAVTTDDDPETPVLLTLVVDIPELVEIQPRLIAWAVGERETEKTVEVFLATRTPLNLTDVKASDPGFDARIITLVPNRQYQLILKPRSTGQPSRSTITVAAKSEPDGNVSHFNVYAQVR